jgi:flagellar basal body P-ring protein FlgI
MVTATLPAYATPDSRSTSSSRRSATPSLRGARWCSRRSRADGEIYALAQGNLGSAARRRAGAARQINHRAGTHPGGASGARVAAPVGQGEFVQIEPRRPISAR